MKSLVPMVMGLRVGVSMNDVFLSSIAFFKQDSWRASNILNAFCTQSTSW